MPVDQLDVSVCPDSQELKEKLEKKVNQDWLDKMENPERKDRQDHKVLLEQLDSQEKQEKMVNQVKMGSQEPLDNQELKERKDQPDSQVHQEQLVCPVLLEVPDKKEKLEDLVLMAHQGLKVNKVSLDKTVLLDNVVKRDAKDHLA